MKHWICDLARCLLVVLPLLSALNAPHAVVAAEELDCLIQANRLVSLSHEIEGVLRSVLVDRGDFVREGEVIATLESRLQKAAVQVARARAQMDSTVEATQARVDFGKRRFTRTKELYDGGISPLSELDEAETSALLADLALVEARDNQRIAELELERAETELELRTIRSPLTGIVISRFLSPGEVAGTAPIVEIAQIEPLRVEVFAPIRLLGKIEEGMNAKVRPEPPVGGVYEATVTIVDRVIDPASGTFGVRLMLPNPDYTLPAGLRCRVQFPAK